MLSNPPNLTNSISGYPALPNKPGRLARNLMNGSSGSNTAITLNTLYIGVIPFSNSFNFSAIKLGNQATAAAQARFGIYDSDSGGMPAALLYDSGDITLDVIQKVAGGGGSFSGNKFYWWALKTNASLQWYTSNAGAGWYATGPVATGASIGLAAGSYSTPFVYATPFVADYSGTDFSTWTAASPIFINGYVMS